MWKKFWRTRVIDRAKLVTWRLFHNSLLFCNLRKRGCNTDQGCVFCGFKLENASHLFVNCWWSKCFWSSLGMENKVWYSVENFNIGDWVWYILSMEDYRIIRLVFIGTWIIWHNRNRAVHGKTPLTLTACQCKAMQYLNQSDSRALMNITSAASGSSTLHFFTDGSWSKSSKKGGMSICNFEW